MLGTIGQSRAAGAAQTVGERLWQAVTQFGASGRTAASRTTSSKSIEEKIQQGRSNAVRTGLYNGTRTEMFDAEGLFCYLVEKAEGQKSGGMEGACDLFESTIGQLPATTRSRAVARFDEAGISAAPDGDDLKGLAAIDMLVDQIVQECLAMQEAGSESSVEESGLPMVAR